MNCFRASRISPETQDVAITDSADPCADLQEEVETLRSSHSEFVPDEIDAAALVDVDANVAASQPVLTDVEILTEFLGRPDDDVDKDGNVEEIEIEDEPSKCPDRNDLLAALELFDKSFLFTVFK